MSATPELSGQPILILKEGTSRSTGKEAMNANLNAAKIIAQAVRSSLGPKGMDKMLVDGFGDVTITNDGATILDEIEVQHPAAKMMVEVAKAQDDEVGDGTTTAVVVAGELLTKAEELLERDVHPTIIVEGYRNASEKALQVLESIAIKVDPTDKKYLKNVASVSIASKLLADYKNYMSDLAVDAVLQVAEKKPDGYNIDLDDIKIEKKAGESLTATKLVKGIILDKEVVHSGMPKKVANAKVALLNCALEIEKTEMDAKINIESPDQMNAFLEEEERMLKEMVENISSSGANVVLCQKGIDDMAQHFLAKKGLLAARRVKESDMSKLSKATDGKIVTNISDLTAKDLGQVDLVEERKISDDRMIFIEGCKNPKAVTILIRGGAERIVNEAERALHDALSVVRDVVRDPRIVAGGGAPEAETAGKLREFSESLSGKAQLAATNFANALEIVPITLAENAGLDPIDIITELRSRHDKGELWSGVDVMTGKVDDMSKLGIYEPLVVKLQVIKSTSEAANMILKIDDVISSSKSKEPGPQGPESNGGESDYGY